MRFATDVDRRRVSLTLPKKQYSLDGVRIAAYVFDSRADVELTESVDSRRLTLTAKRKTVLREDLERLGGEFLNELLNQEYRFVVGRFNKKISDLPVTQVLFCAGGGENPPGPRAEESTPEFQAEVQALLKDAREEIARTMPKKIAPQGNPLPAAKEAADA